MATIWKIWRGHCRAMLIGMLLSIATHAAVLMQTSPAVSHGGAVLGAVGAVQKCAELKSLDLTGIAGSGSRVTSAVELDRDGQTVCEVEGTLAPTIGFKVVLPTTQWTQRYLQVGCGGLCGSINLEVGAADGCMPLSTGGFVVSATDMGHQGRSPDFGRNAQQRVDFAYRGVHLTALASKHLIHAYYGQAQAYSYFTGCSDGGREALMEAQRYPDDFNGIVAGAPAMLFQFQNSLHHGWLAASNTGPDGKSIVVASRLPILHRAVLDACDGLDGLVDGLLSDPRTCHFDPKRSECPAGSRNTSACLTATEVAAVSRFYEGPRDPVSGARLTVGEVQYGSELAWAGVFVPARADRPILSSLIALDALRNLIFEQDPPMRYTLADLKFEQATVELLKARHPLLDATNPDLSRFHDAGGKLILWHGWSDPHISPLTTIAYHEAVLKQMGSAVTKQFERLYLLPGVYHCGRGEGSSAIDLLTPMIDWVEQGKAPDSVMTRTAADDGGKFGQPPVARPAVERDGASAKAAEPLRSRPVYPYPAIAKYRGTGNPDAAASYQAGEALYADPTSAWAGHGFFEPYVPRAN